MELAQNFYVLDDPTLLLLLFTVPAIICVACTYFIELRARRRERHIEPGRPKAARYCHEMVRDHANRV